MDATKHDPRAAAHDSIEDLVRDLTPVRPLNLAREVAAAVAVEIAVVLVAAWLVGARVAGAERLADPRFLALLLALAAGAGASAAAMGAVAVPGRAVPRAWRLVLVALPMVVAAVVAVASPWGGHWKGLLAVFVEGLGCTQHTLEIAAPAFVAGLLWLRRLSPLEPLRVGLFAASSALLTSALAVQMACPSCDAWHLAVTHYMPIALAAWLWALVAPLVLGSGGRR